MQTRTVTNAVTTAPMWIWRKYSGSANEPPTPKEELSCEKNSNSATPLTKPAVTRRGINLIRPPQRIAPATTRSTPANATTKAISKAICGAVGAAPANWLRAAASTTEVEADGPPTEYFELPKIAVTIAATTAQTRPALTPKLTYSAPSGARAMMPPPMATGSETMAEARPAEKSAFKVLVCMLATSVRKKESAKHERGCHPAPCLPHHRSPSPNRLGNSGACHNRRASQSRRSPAWHVPPRRFAPCCATNRLHRRRPAHAISVPIGRAVPAC